MVPSRQVQHGGVQIVCVEFVFHRHDIALVGFSISLASGWDSVVQRRDAVADLFEKVGRQGAFSDCGQVFGQDTQGCRCRR